MENKKIVLEYKDGGIAVIRLNNPPLNLNTLESLRLMLDCVLKISRDDAVRVVVITATEARAFCAGSDMNEFPAIRDNFIEAKLRPENVIYQRLENMEKPVVAAVNGLALGGGCEMALACDFIVMDENAKMGMPESLLGAFPGTGGLFRLPRRVGFGQAMEMLCFGQQVDAHRALQIGLVDRIAPSGTTEEVAMDLALQLASMPRFSLACIKKGVRASMNQTTSEAMEMSMKMTEEIMLTEDSREGTAAFFEKRKPKFKGAYEYEKHSKL